MASASSRALWKGAISFGLVYIPVSLHSATIETEIDFDWLDKRSMDPVGYKRVNKRTGREIDRDQIVKGVAYEKGHYVVLTDDEIRAAYPASTQTIDIEAFVPANEIPFIYLERPYYLAPVGKGKKVYALLREAMLRAGRIGIARVVIQNKQHLAALIPAGPGLVLNLLRWADEIRNWDTLDLPAEGAKAAGLTDKELTMAEQLVGEMSGHWKSEDYQDDFKAEIMKLVQQKIDADQTETVVSIEPQETESKGADILDLTALLQRSLKKGSATNDDKPPAKTARTSRATKTSTRRRA